MDKFIYDPNKPLFIGGFGNILLSDDGAGVNIIQKLTDYSINKDISLFDGGTRGLDLIDLLYHFEQVILIDAMLIPGNNASYKEFLITNSYLQIQNPFLSAHHFNLNTVFHLMDALHIKIPYCLVFGIKPISFEPRIGLSPEVDKTCDVIVEKIIDLININLKEVLCKPQ